MGAEEMRAAGRRLLAPGVDLLVRVGVGPSTVTLAGLALTIVAAVFLFCGNYIAAAAIFIAGSLLDALDGAVARRRNAVSRAGAVLDSSCDRIGETFMYGAMIAGSAARLRPGILLLAPLALGGSYLVSYVRARSEGAGIPCSVGFFTRTERLVLLSVGLAAAGMLQSAEPLLWVCAIVAAGSWATGIQRILRVFSEDGVSIGRKG